MSDGKFLYEKLEYGPEFTTTDASETGVKRLVMENIESINIPESHIFFANEVAALAERNGMTKFTLEYEPHFDRDGGEAWDRRTRGKAIIHYSDKDGRGRPCRKLGITFDASFTHTIETNPES